MLFYLDESIESVDLTDGSEARAGLDNLLVAVGEGKHRLSGGLRLLQSLCRLKGLSSRNRTVLANAVENVSDDYQLLKSLSVHILVSSTPCFSPQRKSARVIEVSFAWLADTARVQPVWLLGENISDAEVISSICHVMTRALAAERKWPVFKVRVAGGGGSTTVESLRAHVLRMEFCLCIVDSDKRFPGDRLGDTARRVRDFIDRLECPLGEVVITSGRMIENHLPDDFLSAFGDWSKVLPRIGQFGGDTIRAHLNFKTGLTLCDIFELADKDASAELGKKLFEGCQLVFSQEVHRFPCSAGETCQNTEACDCRIVRGNSGGVLGRFDSYMAGKSPRDIWVALSSHENSLFWRKVFEFVISWGCARDKIRS